LPLARLFATRHAVVGFDINQSSGRIKIRYWYYTWNWYDYFAKGISWKLGHDKGLYCTTALDEIKEIIIL
jgi:hypothetical protein